MTTLTIGTGRRLIAEHDRNKAQGLQCASGESRPKHSRREVTPSACKERNAHSVSPTIARGQHDLLKDQTETILSGHYQDLRRCRLLTPFAIRRGAEPWLISRFGRAIRRSPRLPWAAGSGPYIFRRTFTPVEIRS